MMTEHAELIREIDKLPVKYVGEVLDFVGYLRQKAQNDNKTQSGEQGQRDLEIINANAERFNKEAEENLEFQAIL